MPVYASINEIVDAAATVADETKQTFGGLSKEQLNWKRGAERWSVAQCFAHLITSNSGYLPIIDSVLKGHKQSSIWQKLPVLPGVWGRLLIKSLDPSTTRKLKAPKKFEPAQSDISATIVEDFVAQQAKVIEGMKGTANLDLERTIITSPALNIVTYSLMDAYRIIVVHERRHFQQARRVIEQTGFPA